eukprot:11961195-Karenia_brevis.AAC.1
MGIESSPTEIHHKHRELTREDSEEEEENKGEDSYLSAEAEIEGIPHSRSRNEEQDEERGFREVEDRRKMEERRRTRQAELDGEFRKRKHKMEET